MAKCGFYLPDHARYSCLLDLSEDQDIAKALEQAMETIEIYTPELEGSLPKDEYYRLTRTEQMKSLPLDLLRQFDNIPDDAIGDIFGHIYEYFLGKFALAEGQGGGTFFTPRSVVRLMVEIIEPHAGTVFDPACGSGGMFVQSAQFIEEHRKPLVAKGGDASVFVSGQEKESETVKLARMNLAVNGLRVDIRQGITHYEDHFDSFGKFDYVLAIRRSTSTRSRSRLSRKTHPSTNASCASCCPTWIRDDRRSISRDALSMRCTPKGKRQHNV